MTATQTRPRDSGGALTVLVLLVAVWGAWTMSAGARARGASACPALHYVLDVAAAPAGAADDVRWAFAAVGRHTGMTIIEEPVMAADQPLVPEAGRVVVTWTALSARPSGAQGLIHLGHAWGPERFDARVGGLIELNASADLPVASESRRSWRGVTLHEIGHLLGLAHSAARDDLMYPALDEGPGWWSPRELGLLAQVGAARGCSPVAPD